MPLDVVTITPHEALLGCRRRMSSCLSHGGSCDRRPIRGLADLRVKVHTGVFGAAHHSPCEQSR